MIRVFARKAALTAMLSTSLTLATLVPGCSTDMGENMGGNQNNPARDQILRSGIVKARAGIALYRSGDAAGGLGAIHEGRDVMGNGMVNMGLGCCMFDGGVTDGDSGAISACASMMGSGAIPVLQGTANFDAAHKTMMASSDTGTIDQCLADMEAGMQMMEQGATQMMGGMGSKGTMSGM
jgi:hypothetical protein